MTREDGEGGRERGRRRRRGEEEVNWKNTGCVLDTLDQLG